MNSNHKERRLPMRVSDFIATLNHHAKEIPTAPAYDLLGQTYTYQKLKQDSDTIAAYIDSLNLPEKSPVMVFGG